MWAESISYNEYVKTQEGSRQLELQALEDHVKETSKLVSWETVPSLSQEQEKIINDTRWALMEFRMELWIKWKKSELKILWNTVWSKEEWVISEPKMKLQRNIKSSDIEKSKTD